MTAYRKRKIRNVPIPVIWAASDASPRQAFIVMTATPGRHSYKASLWSVH
ncbi:hypothetical protein SAMN05192568_10349 [Methylobacterium pseudosasicola]|uniref:Uncharacterized protein n=1 Tax=Methylobacterium pseudosasicola TaxID=582667 RepID=A0A1I4R8U0_9HYPH|nr:hypothetical protein SAMN05192568_10349 [Methylobacterium pseudosasicola]